MYIGRNVSMFFHQEALNFSVQVYGVALKSPLTLGL